MLTWAYGHVEISEAAPFAMLCPVLSVLLGMAVLEETVNLRELAGCALVVVACTYASITKRAAAGQSMVFSFFSQSWDESGIGGGRAYASNAGFAHKPEPKQAPVLKAVLVLESPASFCLTQGRSSSRS
jgi:hypothetical protein